MYLFLLKYYCKPLMYKVSCCKSDAEVDGQEDMAAALCHAHMGLSHSLVRRPGGCPTMTVTMAWCQRYSLVCGSCACEDTASMI